MKTRYALPFAGLTLAALLVGVASAQTATATQKPFEPQVGQAGKDVVWVPTPQPVVDKMLEMAKVTPKDFVMDLGSGDGRTVITAAKRGSRAVGRALEPVHDKIVVAVVDGQMTVKRLHKKHGIVKLLAENADFAEIEFKDGHELIIWGVVTRVLHKV